MRRPDLTVLAIPAFVGAMAAEVLWQRRHPAPAGTTRAGDDELADTIASLTMGVGSLVAPFVPARAPPRDAGRGRDAKVLMAVPSRPPRPPPSPTSRGAAASRAGSRMPGRCRPARARHGPARMPRRVTHRSAAGTGATAVAAVASTALTVATTWSAQTSGTRLFALTRRDLGTGLAANAVAILGWDAIYYWNHRFNHESRWPWAMHVVHHSSERYNLSTALRQPVAEGLTTSVLGRLRGGCDRASSKNARVLNLIDQFWLYTEAVSRSGGSRSAQRPRRITGCTTASTGSTSTATYGSILISWDQLFGTFERRASGRLRAHDQHLTPSTRLRSLPRVAQVSPRTSPGRAAGG